MQISEEKFNTIEIDREKNKDIYSKPDKVCSDCSNVQSRPAIKIEQNENEPFNVMVHNEKREKVIHPPTESLDTIQIIRDSTESKYTPFVIKSANQWIKEAAEKPVPKMILGELWFEDEICILFADTNVGKSILAVQIADIITKSKKIDFFDKETDIKKVLYFDFELTDQQFVRRYSQQEDGKYINTYNFDENFLRVEVNKDKQLSNDAKSYEKSLVTGIETAIIDSGVEIIIIDNLSCIKSDNENAKDAAPFMQQLKAIKDKHHVSVLVLAHTPKRDNSRPLDVNDLAGSKMLSNYADSIFAIGKSQLDKNLRYIKQIKERSTEKIYDSENVCVFEIIKLDNFLKFEFKKFDNESKHLSAPTQKSRESKIAEAKKLYAKGKTQREIADILDISLGTVNKFVNESVQLFDSNKMNILNEDEDVYLGE